MSKRTGGEISCQICTASFYVPKNRLDTAKYCSMLCAGPGRARNANPWAKGKSKKTDPRLARIAEKNSQAYANNPLHNRGANHHAFGKPFSEDHLRRLRRSQSARPATSYNTIGLEKDRDYFRGLTKSTSPAVARRARMQSERSKGVANPAHSARMIAFYDEHPEKHPNRILCSKGHETGIERKMRIGLAELNICFSAQYRIGRYFVDFAIPAKMVAIEVDGLYWHRDREREQRRESAITAKGWRVLRFSENEVNKQLPHCLNQVLNVLNNPLLT